MQRRFTVLLDFFEWRIAGFRIKEAVRMELVGIVESYKEPVF